MTKTYDIAISFAGEDRAIAREIASELASEKVSVFYDEFEKADLWGKDLYEHLISVYKDKSKYCLMLLSDAYARKLWTSHERKAAQARAFKERKEYILPLKLDDTEVPGILETVGYIDYRSETAKSIATLLLKKLWGDLENDRGLNTLKVQLEEMYMRMMLLCDLAFMPSDHSEKNQQASALSLFEGAMNKFRRLKQDVQINAPQTDKLVLIQITRVLDGIENILERSRFLLNLNNPALADYFFVSEIPETDFYEVYSFLNKLKIFDGYAIKNKRHYKPDEIICSWKRAEMESKRYGSNPANFKKEGNLKTIVFNYTTLRSLKIENSKSDYTVRVFKDSN